MFGQRDFQADADATNLLCGGGCVFGPCPITLSWTHERPTILPSTVNSRYSDDKWEYRHVILPKSLLKQIKPEFFEESGVLRILSDKVS